MDLLKACAVLSLLLVSLRAEAIVSGQMKEKVKSFEDNALTYLKNLKDGVQICSTTSDNAARSIAIIKYVEKEVGRVPLIEQELRDAQALILKPLDPGGKPLAEEQIAGVRLRMVELERNLASAQRSVREHDAALGVRNMACLEFERTFPAVYRELEKLSGEIKGLTPEAIAMALKSEKVDSLRNGLPELIEKVSVANRVARDSGCNPAVFDTKVAFNLVNGLDSENLLVSLQREQKTTLEGVSSLLVVISDLSGNRNLSASAANEYNSAIGLLSDAAFANTEFQVNLALDLQLIEVPKQQFELSPGNMTTGIGALVTIASGALGILGPSPTTPEQGKPLPGLFDDPRNLAIVGAGLGVLTTAVGQLLNSSNVPPVVQRAADRVAINRLVGLSVQQVSLRIDHLRKQLGSTSSDESKMNEAAYKLPAEHEKFAEFVGERLDEWAKKSAADLSPDSLKTLKQTHDNWVQAHQRNEAAIAAEHSRLVAVMQAANVRAERFAAVLDANRSGLHELRELLGQKADSYSGEKLKCKDGSEVTAQAFLDEFKPTGQPHFASGFLSKEGVVELLRLGACNYEIFVKAASSMSDAQDKIAAGQENTKKLQDNLTKQIGARRLELTQKLRPILSPESLAGDVR